MSNIGKTIKITGDIAGSEDLIVEGKIEGEVQLPGNRILLSEAGSIHGDLHVASVEVRGRFNGRIVASETVTLGSTAKAEGSILSPSIEMADGAGFRGAVETRSGKS
jgi:cytoskeletal protein CcmA (bactofilin family)